MAGDVKLYRRRYNRIRRLNKSFYETDGRYFSIRCKVCRVLTCLDEPAHKMGCPVDVKFYMESQPMKTIYEWTGEHRRPETGEWFLCCNPVNGHLFPVCEDGRTVYSERYTYWILSPRQEEAKDE